MEPHLKEGINVLTLWREIKELSKSLLTKSVPEVEIIGE